MQGWLRNGLLAGAVSGTATLLLGLLRAAVKSDYCQAGAIIGVGHPPAVDIALNLSAVAILLLLAGAAGRQTANAGASRGKAGLAGLITGTTSGVGLLVLNVLQFDQYTVCMVRGGVAGPGMDMRPTLLIMAVVAIAVGAGLAVIAGFVGAAARRT